MRLIFTLFYTHIKIVFFFVDKLIIINSHKTTFLQTYKLSIIRMYRYLFLIFIYFVDLDSKSNNSHNSLLT